MPPALGLLEPALDLAFVRHLRVTARALARDTTRFCAEPKARYRAGELLLFDLGAARE